MVNGIIMLEGNKGTFKTTIAKQLSAIYKCEIIKGIPKGESSLIKNYATEKDAQSYLCEFWDNILIQAQSKLIITDRTYATPIAFHGVFHDSNREFIFVNKKQHLQIEKKILQIPYAFIFLSDDSKRIWERYTNRGVNVIATTDFIRNISEIELLNERFEYFFDNCTQLDYCRIDCQQINPSNPQGIVDYIDKRIISS